jgi:predicted regulator of Ras-like GTPase activity (Roadblock/LC7/MglB family)
MYQAAKALGELCKVGAKVALLATRDGLLIESVTGQQPPSDLDSAAAGAAGALEAGKLMVSGLTPACVQSVLVELEHGGVMTVHPIDDEMILAVLADTFGGLGRLLVELRRLIPMITAAVDAGTGDSDGVTSPRFDAPAVADVQNTYVISSGVASLSADEEKTLSGPVPGTSRHDVNRTARGTNTGLPQATQPPEAEAACASGRPAPAGSAEAVDHGPSSSQRPELLSVRDTRPRSDNQRELASAPVRNLQEAAAGSSVDRLLPQGTDGAPPDSVAAEPGLRSAATTRSEENIGFMLAGVHLDVTGQVATATVEVTYQERRATGRAVGRNQPTRNLFLVAEATAQAVTKLLPRHHGVMVETVPSFSSGGVEAWPRLIWLSPAEAEVHLQMVRTDDTSPQGIANAVLHAVNERLGALLAKP